MVLSHFPPITSSPASLESRALQAVHQHPPITLPEDTSLTNRDSARKLQSCKRRASVWVSKTQISYLLSATPCLSGSWGEDLGVLWRFTLSAAGRTQSWSGILFGQSRVPGACQGCGCWAQPECSSGSRDRELPLTLQGSRPWSPWIWSTPGCPSAFLPRTWH